VSIPWGKGGRAKILPSRGQFDEGKGVPNHYSSFTTTDLMWERVFQTTVLDMFKRVFPHQTVLVKEKRVVQHCSSFTTTDLMWEKGMQTRM
jgi:hypothetical protein